MASSFRSSWTLDPGIAFLNHGSFGACPAVVLEEQARLRARLEAQPVLFMRELEPLLDEARAALAAFLRAGARDLGFVPNATTGVNAVLRSLVFAPGDEIVTTDHTYNACRNALDWVAARAGARVVVATVPFPLRAPHEVVAAVMSVVGPRTRLALLDHVTSPTALVFPIADLVAALADRGVDTLVDGAHAPGMLPLDLTALGAAYYAGNCHKWLCAPKSVGFLHVRPDRQDGIVPTTISHGANATRTDKSRFQLLFDWAGTIDPTPILCLPATLRFMESLLPGGWPEVMKDNHELALRARDRLCAALDVAPPAPDEMIGSMAAVPLPGAAEAAVPTGAGGDPLQEALWQQGAIEVPVFAWSSPSHRLIRVSAQLYNTTADYDRLADALGPERGIAPVRRES